MRIINRWNKGLTVSTILNILGMTVALAALYIILVQVHHDLSFNKAIKDSDRIYQVAIPDWSEKGKYMTWVNRPPFEQVIASCPEIEAGGTGFPFGEDMLLNKTEDDKTARLKVSTMSKGALDVFSFELVDGSWDNFLNDQTLAVSESEAKKLGLAVGDKVFLRNTDFKNGGGGKFSSTVVAIYKDMPVNSDLSSFDSFSCIGNRSIDDWSEWSYYYYFKAKKGVSVSQLEKKAGDMIVSLILSDSNGSGVDAEGLDKIESTYKLHLVPLQKTYFDETINSYGAIGNKKTTFTLLAVAILVLVIAFINFINFFFATVPLRIHSINTRKVLGASRSGLIARSISSSVWMILVSLALAAAIVLLFNSSPYADLISCSAAFGKNISVGIFTAVLALVFSVASSLYPSFYITSFSPAFALKGSFGATARGKTLRWILIGLQFVISISLVICATFIGLQRNFMIRHDMGFNREELIVAQVSGKVCQASESVADQLKSDSQIKDVTWANGDIVSSGRMGWGRDFKGQEIHFECYPVAWNFLKFMGIPIVEGRDFTEADEQSETGVFIFNETARKKFGMTLEDKIAGHMGDTEIAGFCKDFNFKGLQEGVSPFCLYIFGKHPWKYLTTLFVRTQKNADIARVMSEIKKTVLAADPEMDPESFDVQLFDKSIQQQYQKESNLSRLVTLFTILAIVISLMGVFGLVLFETEYRRKEIGIRRVNGASVKEILNMFNLKFVRIVLVCFLVAAPLSWWIVDSYLKSFAFRVPVHLWVFLAALAAVLLVTVAVVTLRSLDAATENPADVLRKD